MESESDTQKFPHPNAERRTHFVQHLEGFPSSSSHPIKEFDPSLMPDFPSEIVIEILLRLPAKSLGKFKCVSRSWLSLISSPRFIKTHLAVASERDDFEHHRLIFSVYFATGRYSSLLHHEVHSVSSLLYSASNKIATFFEIDYPGLGNKEFWLVGSCCGLVCLLTRDNALFLCNPCTKKFRKLPDVGIELGYSGDKFGFGYDARNDDYKVIVVAGYEEIHVYSLKTNSWRKMEHFKFGATDFHEKNDKIMDGKIHFASGKFYWPVMDGNDNWKIASLDLENEAYEVMDRPNNTEFKRVHRGLGVTGGRLCVIYDGFTRADVWVLKDSWIKVVSIPCDVEPGPFLTYQSVCTSRNGEILCILRTALFLYDQKTNTCRRYPYIGSVGRAVMYVEGLVQI